LPHGRRGPRDGALFGVLKRRSWYARPMAITTILFDAGGTLVFPSFGRIARELGAEGAAADPAALARADAGVRFEIDRPEVIAATSDGSRFRRYLDTLAGAAGLPRMPAAAFERLDT